jgi:hypothetical protein
MRVKVKDWLDLPLRDRIKMLWWIHNSKARK